jgi:fatty acid desaturase
LWNYTGERNVPLPDAFQWLAAKRKGDNVGDLWRVHDKLYNLERFIKQHPGGADWIKLSRGTDITEAFESSHVVNVGNVEKILAKYYVQDATTKRNSPYTFKKDGFYETLKRRIEPVLKEVGTGPTKQVKFFQDFMALAFILTAMLGAYLESIPVLIAAGVMLDACLTSAHNFFHLRDSWRMYYFDLGLISSYEWRISHAMSHHMYPNTLLDLEVSMTEPMLMFLPTKSKNFIQRYAVFIYQHIIYFGGFFPVFIKRVINTLRGKISFRPEILLPFVEIAILTHVAPTFLSGFKAWLLVQGTSTYLFGFVGLAAGHHHPVCFHDGDEPRPDPDFGLCQLDATKDKTHDICDNLFVILSTFGNHPMHHLFPAICHSKLHHIKPIMEATVKEFDEENKRFSQWQLVVGLQEQYARNTANNFKKSRNH